MSKRFDLLKQANSILDEYVKSDTDWRPVFVDLIVYDNLLGMHESDYDNGSTVPDYLWRKTPDEIMQIIIDSPKIFDMEYGWDSFDDDVRQYLIDNNFIVDPMDVSDEEYQNNLEGK